MTTDSLSILCISDIIPGDAEGGSGRVAWELSRGLLSRGHRIAILTRGSRNLPDQEVIDGISVHRFFTNPLRGRRVFRKLVKMFTPDVLVVNQPLSGLCALPLRGPSPIPILYIFHSPWPEEYQIRSLDLGRSSLRDRLGTYLRRRMEGRILEASGKIVTLSEFMASRLNRWHHVPAGKVAVIPGGVDTARFNTRESRENARLRLDVPLDRFVILTVRNLVSRMGLEALVSAMKPVVEARPDALLIIGGRGYLEAGLNELVRENGLENNVRLAGYIDEKHLPAYYRAADLFVLPTAALEGFGLVTLEAMACGTPVLGTPVGGTVEILSGFDERFLFPDCSSGGMAAGIRAFMERSGDPADLQRKCRSFVEEHYSWERFAEGVEGTVRTFPSCMSRR